MCDIESRKDIQTILTACQDAQKAIEQSTKAVAGTFLDSDKQVREWLQQTIQGVGEVLAFIQKTVNELWSRYWRERIIDAIRGERSNHFKAREVVKKLKRDYPDETECQIAERIIMEKALFTTITGTIHGLTAGITKVVTPISNLRVKFLSTRSLLVEMIYQIGVVYGFDEFKEGDLLTILAVALNVESITKLAMDFLLSDSMPDPIISGITNMILFLVVGYVAREFYEAKVKGKAIPMAAMLTFTALEAKVEAYLEKAISEQTTIETAVVQAVSIQEQLTLSSDLAPVG